VSLCVDVLLFVSFIVEFATFGVMFWVVLFCGFGGVLFCLSDFCLAISASYLNLLRLDK
jgi:hypothetical protein